MSVRQIVDAFKFLFKLMPNTTKSNRLKRKRGKKFVFHENKTEDKKEEQNPFEEHSKTRKFTKDLEKR